MLRAGCSGSYGSTASSTLWAGQQRLLASQQHNSFCTKPLPAQSLSFACEHCFFGLLLPELAQRGQKDLVQMTKKGQGWASDLPKWEKAKRSFCGRKALHWSVSCRLACVYAHIHDSVNKWKTTTGSCCSLGKSAQGIKWIFQNVKSLPWDSPMSTITSCFGKRKRERHYGTNHSSKQFLVTFIAAGSTGGREISVRDTELPISFPGSGATTHKPGWKLL